MIRSCGFSIDSWCCILLNFHLDKLHSLSMTLISTAIDFAMEFQWHILVVLITAYFTKSYIQYRRLSAFNGPWLAGWTDLWFAKAAFGTNQCAVLAEVCEKYGTYHVSRCMRSQVLTITPGSIARIGLNTLVTSSPDLIMRMSAARSPYTRGDWYAASRIPPGQDNIFTLQDDEKHGRRKAQMADGVRKAFLFQ